MKTSELSSKDWWKTLKTFLNPLEHSSVPVLHYNGNDAEDDQSKANLLNDYFICQTLLHENDSEVPLLPINNTIMPDFQITPEEVLSIMKNLPLGKASGPDEVNNRVLRELADELHIPLCRLFNKSLTDGIVPESWKEAHVTAVFKKGDPSLASNYRPISLLSNIDKLMERIIFKHIYNFLRDTNYLSSFQSGFIPGDSTVNQLTLLYHSFCRALDEGKEVRVVFFDISKAFDRVWHKGIIAKLRSTGLSNRLLSWLENYLFCRKQRVVIPGGMSGWSYIKAGVPQGSILGPLMFLVYINDIVSEVSANIRLFADDTSLYIIVDHPQRAADILQDDISKISDWANSWLVTFNPQKTESLLISRKTNKPHHPTLFMLNESIAEVDSHKHLGIFLSSDGSWHDHINYIKNKAWQRINIMRKLKHNLDRKSLEIIYTSFIRPILEYADVIWDNCSQYEKQELEKIQHEAARIATGATKLVSIIELYKEIGWESLENRRYNHKLTLFYKMINSLTPSYLSSMVPPLVSDTTRYSLRNSNDIRIPSSRTQLFHDSYIPSVVEEWNKLPMHIRNSPSVESFKRSLNSARSPPPSYYYTGDRRSQILHTRLRTNCSPLNLPLFQKNIVASPLCTCGEIESTDHFLLRCNLYNDIRVELLSNIRPLCTVTTELLLFGNPNLPIAQNSFIFKHVQKYIKDSKRF